MGERAAVRKTVCAPVAPIAELPAGEGACASEPLAPLADAQRNRLCVAYLSAKDWLCRLPVEGEVAVDCVVVPIGELRGVPWRWPCGPMPRFWRAALSFWVKL